MVYSKNVTYKQGVDSHVNLWKKLIQFQSALQRMINRNQGKAGFSVSVVMLFLKKIAVDQFVCLYFNVSCIPTENKTGLPRLFLFISANECFCHPCT